METFIQAQRRTYLEEEEAQVFQLDEGGGIWVELCPGLSEFLPLFIVEQAFILPLGVFEAFNNDADQQLEENKVDEELETHEEEKGAISRAAANSLIAIIHIVFIGGVIFALVPRFIGKGEGSHGCVPGVSSSHCEQSYEGVCEALKVNVGAHVQVPLYLSEVDHPDY